MLVEMRMNGLDKSYELLVNYYQMNLLLLYNDGQAYTIDELKGKIGTKLWDVEYQSALKARFA